MLLPIFQKIIEMPSNSQIIKNGGIQPCPQVKSLEDNETWELVTLPPGEVALGGQWILGQKFDWLGTFTRNRARWVICGNQEKGMVDAHDIYAAIVDACVFYPCRGTKSRVPCF